MFLKSPVNPVTKVFLEKLDALCNEIETETGFTVGLEIVVLYLKEPAKVYTWHGEIHEQNCT